MNEKMPEFNNEENFEINKLKEERFKLAIELFESGENFDFPGINIDSYETIKSEELEFPGYSTPIDELLEKFEKEGLKIALPKTKESKGIAILPGESKDIIDDNLMLKHLDIGNINDEKLKKLVSLDNNIKSLSK